MKHASLFSGIGGFDLAAEWMGWENVFHCEWMEFPRKVLDYYWPNADSHTDICKTNFKKYANTIDILTGGFPCQPFSLAGKRKGTDDERYLWGEMLRAVQEIKPKYVIAENVFGIANIDGGLVFEQVCLDLENEGYEVQPFIIPAASKNAPHRRDRVWFIATHPQYVRLQHSKEGRNIQSRPSQTQIERSEFTKPFKTNGIDGNATNAKRTGLERQYRQRYGCSINWPNKGVFIRSKDKFIFANPNGFKWGCLCGQQPKQPFKTYAKYCNTCGKGYASDPNLSGCKDERKQPKPTTQNTRIKHSGCGWEQFPTQSPLCSRNDGLSTKLDRITFSKWRVESIKAYGNAIVPQVALEIFKVIEKIDCDLSK
jgi:DNA (cytosine-5)-methyltransferase 1